MTILRTIAATALLMGFASMGMASEKVDPATSAAVTEKLTAEGYDVRSVQMEDGMIEVYAIKDGAKLEIYLNDAYEIVKVKNED